MSDDAIYTMKTAVKRGLFGVLSTLGGLVMHYPALTSLVKPERVPRHPFARKVWGVMFGVQNMEPKDESFSQIGFDGFDVLFSNGPLADGRGIGRVCRAQLEHLTALSAQAVEVVARKDAAGRRAVYFYTSVHWCPRELAPNTVVMIHDVIPLLFPKKFFGARVGQWRYQFKQIVAQAAHVVTISEASAEAISRLLEVPRDRISVVYNGVSRLPVDDNAQGLALPSKPYVVFLGAAGDPHKNVEVVLQSLARPELTDVDLVMIGEKSEPFQHKVRKSGLSGRVHFMGKLDDGQVGYVLTHSKGLVFPSLYEGFGLPPMEAALLGVPSLCSDRPAMNETLAGAASFIEPQDVGGWTAAIRRLVDDAPFREALARSAQAKVAEFTWDRSARQLLDVLESLAK